MTRKRVVVAGLGDSGVLTAIRLARHTEVIGISAKPALLSGQELGLRLARPEDWADDYWVPFDRFRGLDPVTTIQATLTGVDLAARRLLLRRPDASSTTLDYDVLVISTGVRNGFWRQPALQSADEIGAELRATHHRLAAAESVIVIGGGAAAVSSAANLAARWPDKRVELFYPAHRPLLEHHPRVWSVIRRRLSDAGVLCHSGHRAQIPDGFDCDRITGGPVLWSTGQSPATADAVLWAVGRTRPNTEWLPAELLDEDGFVRVTPQLRVPGQPGVFAIGDVAATDPLRSSARNRADGLLAHNIRADLAGRPLRSYRPPARRWGSVLGAQSTGLEVFAPTGHAFRLPVWFVHQVLRPWIVRRAIYRGVRDNRPRPR